MEFSKFLVGKHEGYFFQLSIGLLRIWEIRGRQTSMSYNWIAPAQQPAIFSSQSISHYQATSMAATVHALTKCKLHGVINFLHAGGSMVEIHGRMSIAYVEIFRYDSSGFECIRNFKKDEPTSIMKMVRNANLSPLKALFSKLIRRSERNIIRNFLKNFQTFKSMFCTQSCET